MWLLIANCIGAPTQEGLSFKLYTSCIGAADGNNTKHSEGQHDSVLTPLVS